MSVQKTLDDFFLTSTEDEAKVMKFTDVADEIPKGSSITKSTARTLYSYDVHPTDCTLFKIDESGWAVRGYISQDYYEWVNDFEAYHPEFGRVWGNFECEVFADTKEGYENFIDVIGYNSWCYGDI